MVKTQNIAPVNSHIFLFHKTLSTKTLSVSQKCTNEKNDPSPTQPHPNPLQRKQKKTSIIDYIV